MYYLLLPLAYSLSHSVFFFFSVFLLRVLQYHGWWPFLLSSLCVFFLACVFVKGMGPGGCGGCEGCLWLFLCLACRLLFISTASCCCCC
ncbi:hypothetical protein FN846DRAFT_937890 [Sphaerosporella brunnea]|uniref:Uncharacterized protein n=1 Tax=Sphaerosporella brunnea TaxID=1250544 RepID=A0A5J5F3Z7_9PEZI|nr:hypothetical protein FN846DRAFT_937890 [Sphaerosporella brunnea]